MARNALAIAVDMNGRSETIKNNAAQLHNLTNEIKSSILTQKLLIPNNAASLNNAGLLANYLLEEIVKYKGYLEELKKAR